MIISENDEGQKFKMVYNETFLLRDVDDTLEIFIDTTNPEIKYKVKVTFFDEDEPIKDQCWNDEKEFWCLLIIHKRYQQTDEDLANRLAFETPGRRIELRTMRSINQEPKTFSITVWATVSGQIERT